MPRERNGITVNCEVCLKSVYLSPGRAIKNKTHTCSKKCCGVIAKTTRNQQVTVQCFNCKKDVKYKKSYIKKIAHPSCSYECSAKIRSISYSKENNPRALKLSPIETFMWTRCKEIHRRAKGKSLMCDLKYTDLLDVYNVQKGLCYYSKLELKMHNSGPIQYDSLSVDRKDSSIGYTKSNVVLCLNSVNTFKSNHSIENIKLVIVGLFKNMEKYK